MIGHVDLTVPPYIITHVHVAVYELRNTLMKMVGQINIILYLNIRRFHRVWFFSAIYVVCDGEKEVLTACDLISLFSAV